MKRSLSLVITCLAACSFTPGKLVGDSSVVRDDAPIDTMVDAGQCTATSIECVNDTLRQCASAGAMATDTVCNWGCSTTGTPHCATVTPAANALTATDLDVYPTLVDVPPLGDGILFDTVFGQIGTLADSNSVRSNGQGIMNGIYFENRNGVGVFRVKSLHITSGTNNPLGFVGTNAVAIVADGEIVIEGFVSVRGPCTMASPHTPGPGGFAGGTAHTDGLGSGGGTGTNTNDFGAGGGGYGGMGGIGGSATVGTTGATGGAVYGDAVISMLIGGSGGGSGPAGGAAEGGGGGGALQLVSNTRIRIVSGGINAGGCGGESVGGGSDGGGGGGAGGTLLLEAPQIVMSAGAVLAANGGGGGCGRGTGLGEPGHLYAAAALGKSGCTGGDGGPGGSGTLINGGNGATVAGEPGGGGGGSVGRIRLNTRNASDTSLSLDNAAVISPALSTTAATRGAATVQ